MPCGPANFQRASPPKLIHYPIFVEWIQSRRGIAEQYVKLERRQCEERLARLSSTSEGRSGEAIQFTTVPAATSFFYGDGIPQLRAIRHQPFYNLKLYLRISVSTCQLIP